MKNRCVLVIGLGSMGRRRSRLIQKMDESIRIIGIDSEKSRREQANKELGIKTVETIKQAVSEYLPSEAFVCTSPLSHAEIISNCLDYGLNVFTEINLVSDGYEENRNKATEKGLKIFMSSTPLYREEIRYIKKQVHQVKGRVNYIYHVGQYLPDWHPWESYKNFFVGSAPTNGCREVFAIEMPWIIDTFGKITSVMVQKCKITELDISYPDSFQVLFCHETGAMGTVVFDVVSRKAVRHLEIYGEEIYLEWDGTPFGLKQYNISDKKMQGINLYPEVEQNPEYSTVIVENMYTSEIEAFFNYVENDVSPLYTMEKDLEVLALIDRIEG